VTPGFVNNLPAASLFPAGARGSVLPEVKAELRAERNLADSANRRIDILVPESATGFDSGQQAGFEAGSGIVSRNRQVEPVLELDDLPATTRNALNAYQSAQQALNQNSAATADETQSIVGVDLFV